VHKLPAGTSLRSALVHLGWLGGLVSVPLWFPAVLDALEDADPSLAWPSRSCTSRWFG